MRQSRVIVLFWNAFYNLLLWKDIGQMIFIGLNQHLYERLGSLFVLFCTHEIHQMGMLQIAFLVSLESSQGRGGASAWFHGVWTCGVEVLEYWMISSLKIKLNRSWKFRRNWNVPLMLLERSWCTGLNGIYLVRFDSEWGRYWFSSDFWLWKFKYKNL